LLSRKPFSTRFVGKNQQFRAFAFKARTLLDCWTRITTLCAIPHEGFEKIRDASLNGLNIKGLRRFCGLVSNVHEPGEEGKT